MLECIAPSSVNSYIGPASFAITRTKSFLVRVEKCQHDQWKKEKGDSPVHRSIKDKRERWMSINNRDDQTITEFLKDQKVFESYSVKIKGKILTIDLLDKLYNSYRHKCNTGDNSRCSLDDTSCQN